MSRIDPETLSHDAEEKLGQGSYNLAEVVMRCTVVVVWALAVVAQGLERAIRDQDDDDDC